MSHAAPQQNKTRRVFSHWRGKSCNQLLDLDQGVYQIGEVQARS
jgi:hypothetical protein